MAIIGNKISLSHQVAQSISRQVRRGVYHSGSMLPPMRKLCDEFDVSLNVVSRAIHELEESGLVETHHGKGVMVCEEKLADRTAILFGFLHPYPTEMIFEQQVLQYAEQGFGALDNFVVARSSNMDTSLEREIAQHFVNNGVQGLLLWPAENNPNGKFFEELSKKIPIILLDRLLKDADLPAVIFDTYEAGREICAETLVSGKRKRMLVWLDDIQISPYEDLVRGLRDEAEAMGRHDDVMIVRLNISDFIKRLNACDYSQVDVLRDEVKRQIKEGGYDTFFCPQDELLDYVVVQTGLHDQLGDLQLATIAGPGLNSRTRKYNESGVWRWITDFPELMATAVDMLQRHVLTRNSTEGVVKLHLRRSQP